VVVLLGDPFGHHCVHCDKKFSTAKPLRNHMTSDHAGCLTPDRNEPPIDDVDADDFDSPDSESSESVSSEKTAQDFENSDDTDSNEEHSSDWSSKSAFKATNTSTRRITETKTMKRLEPGEKISTTCKPRLYCQAVGCEQYFTYPRFLENHEREVHLGSSRLFFSSVSYIQ